MKNLISLTFAVIMLTSQAIYSSDLQGDGEIDRHRSRGFRPTDGKYIYVGVDPEREVALYREDTRQTTFFERLRTVSPAANNLYQLFWGKKD
jgi:hypothetical protein